MRKLLRLFPAIVAVGIFVTPVLAHHGIARYDTSKTINLQGTITSFDWTNPHCLIHIDTKDDRGTMQHWTLELSSTLMMTRRGWNKDSLKVGDTATIETHPAKNGAPIGLTADSDYLGHVLVNGKPLPTP